MFKEISPKEFINNAPAEFGDKRMFLTAGNEEAGFNTMTIAWGQFVSIWGRKGLKGCILTAVCYENYPLRDYHEMYIGEIVRVLQKTSQQCYRNHFKEV